MIRVSVTYKMYQLMQDRRNGFKPHSAFFPAGFDADQKDMWFEADSGEWMKLLTFFTSIVNQTAAWRNQNPDHVSALAATKRIRKALADALRKDVKI